jgi:predicted lipoprotein with Yx(FWY)xxD motif/polyisoprenoid-binding protein YceI
MFSKQEDKSMYTGVKRKLGLMGFIMIVVLLMAACQSQSQPTPQAQIQEEKPEEEVVFEVVATEESMVVPSVTVEDQSIESGKVTVAEVVSNGTGWLVVHAQADGKPGPILGFSPVIDGENSDVMVEIDSANATETLYAMLHTDAGDVGSFEFPDGPDGPVKVDAKVVTPSFMVTAGLAAEIDSAEVESEGLITLSGDDVLGPYLIGEDGMTLYIFTRDELGVTNCYDQCAVNWPPLMLEEGVALAAGEGVTGELATTPRDDGGMQVTYNGWPLYYWVKDAVPGDTTGHGVGAVWAVATPEISAYNFVPAESQASYEVGETFINDNNRFAVAVGVTDQLGGRVFLDPSNPLAAWVAPVTIDISTLTSDSNRRDDKIRTDFLQSAQFPIATFVPTQIEGLPESYTPGEQVDLQIHGDLTVREVTQPVTFQATIQGEEGNLTGEATATILMSDFGVGPISILGILETEDEVKLTFNFVARP